ncbi:MAG: tRNA pseudouridine(55) synthase TruB [Gemmataceae bacterium]
MQPMTAALAELPQVSLTRDEEKRFRQGQTIAAHAGSGEAAVFGEHGHLIGIGAFDRGLHPRVVLNG